LHGIEFCQQLNCWPAALRTDYRYIQAIPIRKPVMTGYIWRVKTRLPERYMTPCKVLARGKRNSCLVEFEDGDRVITSRNYLMKVETMQKRRWKEASNIQPGSENS
jgi:hypothetical protein